MEDELEFEEFDTRFIIITLRSNEAPEIDLGEISPMTAKTLFEHAAEIMGAVSARPTVFFNGELVYTEDEEIFEEYFSEDDE